MKKKSCVTLLVMLALLNACTSQTEPKLSTSEENAALSRPADLAGYVTKLDQQKALVVSNKGRVINPSRPEYYEAIWVSNVPKDVAVGQYVEIWMDGFVLSSYPGQGKAARLIRAEQQKPDKADLSPDEVIRKAMETQGLSLIYILVIDKVVYDEQADHWTIAYKNAGISDDRLETYSVQIADR